MISLEGIKADSFPLHHITTVAPDRSGTTWREFIRRSVSLSRQLKYKDSSKNFLVYCESSVNFAVSLFAVWLRGGTAVLPPNQEEGTIRESLRDTCGLINDTELSFDNCSVYRPQQVLSSEPEYTEFSVSFSSDAEAIILYTSGSTGERKKIHKSFSHLSSEILTLEKEFGRDIKDSTVFSTVSHQHIYGLLHKVLWPLCSGRCFREDYHFYPEKILEDMEQSGDTVLISGPAHLKRMPGLVDLSRMNEYCTRVFSSGGLLTTEASKAFSDASGLHPIEILGSTETGGVAWRQQDRTKKSRHWKLIDGVAAAPDARGFIKVRSPFVSAYCGSGWFTMGDKAEFLTEKEFILLGRGDRIVNIGEKRLSLNDLEIRMKASELIEDSAVFAAENKEGTRKLIYAVIVSSKKGRSILSAHGKRELVRRIRRELDKYFSSVHIPRYYRFTDSIPENAQGKRPVSILKKVFED